MTNEVDDKNAKPLDNNLIYSYAKDEVEAKVNIKFNKLNFASTNELLTHR